MEMIRVREKERFEEKVPQSQDKIILQLNWGNTLVVNSDKQEIKLLDDNQVTQMTIGIKQKGLSLTINAITINVNAIEELNLTSKKINLTASEQIEIKSDGDILYEIGNNSITEVGGTNINKADSHKITAAIGNVEIKANDDVRLDGERVKLNCI